MQRVNRLNSSDTKVIDKNIIYKDTVLPLKELGENIKVTHISNVEEFWIESCLNKIFESNPDVVFNTIQYSKKDKKIYFYTDQNISTKAWDDRHLVNYKPLNNTTSILEEIKRILLSENNFDANSVSLYDVAKLVRKKEKALKLTIEHYTSSLKKQCKAIYDKYDIFNLRINGLNKYNNNVLELKINFDNEFNYKCIVFAKNNDDLYLKSDSTKFGVGKEMFLHCSSQINECYDELMKFREYNEQGTYGCRALNSCFFFDIYSNGVSIHNKEYNFRSDFELELISDSFKYSYNVNSNSVLEVLRDNEDKVLKNIFVNISDCPEWMQEELHSLRINQLEEEQIIFEEEQRKIEEEKKKEMKKQKRL